MLYNFILLFFLSIFSLHAAAVQRSQPKGILMEALDWDQKFGSHVKNDAGYRHFADTIHADDAFTTLDHFEEIGVCSVFSDLRCATCFAMLYDPSVCEDVFVEAIKACHAAEIYQVFVAADSSAKGAANSRKFQKLKGSLLQLQRPPEELSSTGALFWAHAWLPKTINTYQSGIFEQEFSWLQTWVDAHDDLTAFLEQQLTVPFIDIFERLKTFCNKNPYVLSHIDKSHFQKYAYALMPALLKEDNLDTFLSMVQSSCMCDMQKEELLGLLRELTHLSGFELLLHPDALEAHSICFMDTIWTVLQSVSAQMTKEQWELCVVYLRQNYAWVEDAFTGNNRWVKVVFAHKKLPEVVISSTTSFNYYMHHHAPCIFQKHEQIINGVSQTLKKYCVAEQPDSEQPDSEQYCSEDDKILCDMWRKRIHDNNMYLGYRLLVLNGSLALFLPLRCCILWKLAEEEKLPEDFSPLLEACFYAEKKALNLNAQRVKNAKTPGMKILKNITLPVPTTNLSRISIFERIHGRSRRL